MDELPQLRTARLILRMPEVADVPEIVRYYEANAEHFAPFDPPLPANFRTEAYWTDRVETIRLEYERGLGLRWFCFLADAPGTLVATIGYSMIQRGPAQYCNLGYALAEAQQGQGLMHEGLEATIAYAFETLNLHRIQANYMPHNRRSGKVLRRLGFVVEGYARDYLLIAGEWQDHVLTSLTNPNWRNDFAPKREGGAAVRH